MILDSITLDNFGAYCGRQEAILTPEPDRPIILFGGMNGGGKTTLLDAIQLAFYGPKARISNRGKLGYKDYLRESIHRAGDPTEGAGITLRFRRVTDGETRNYELQRYWRQGNKGIEERVRVLRDGLPDDIFTDHWEETIESYLPSSIAHLFFFDGEQIKDLAEGGHAAEIIGTAVHSLLGLDLVDRLETDLKVFERRKRSEGVDAETSQKLAQTRIELEEIDRECEKAAMAEGGLVNEASQLAKKLHVKEDLFRSEGGDLYLRRKDLDGELEKTRSEKSETEAQFRELVAGPLPLLMVDSLLGEIELLVRHETDIRKARILMDVLESRDANVVESLKASRLDAQPIELVENILEKDRRARIGLANEQIMLDADDNLSPHLVHLRGSVLPAAQQQAQDFVSKLAMLDDQITRLESELVRVPTAERIADIQNDLDAARHAHQIKLVELEAVRVRKQALERQRIMVNARLDKLGENDVDSRFAEDDKQRILKHSLRVRDTLANFRVNVVKRHAANMESLMLESFLKLLRKKELVSQLTVNPETFEATLTGKDQKPLPFERLSAGERQLLATSLLWGLARASGRPVPTIIDTPLGRLDSSHRRHLVERYFPYASHQVLLLSTDEEIVGKYHEALKPFISRTYLLDHDENAKQTYIKEGYFNS